MAGGIPDIGVRLTAQGVQDVVNAFEKIRTEGKKTGKETADGFSLISGQLSSIAGLLPALSAGAAVAGIVAMGVSAVETAENLAKMSEKTGIAVGTLSVLNLAAKETGTDQEVLGKGLGKLTKSMQDAANGAAKPKKAFTDLGISLRDLQTHDPGQVFGMIADKLASIESPGLRAQAIMGIFGKAGLELIPVLNKVAEEGFGNLEAKAKRLGVYFDSDFAESAKKTKSDLADLKAAGEGIATQFTIGLLPAVTGVTEAFLGMTGSASGFREVGALVGEGIVGLAGVFITVGYLAETFFKGLKVGGLAVYQTYEELASHFSPTEAGRSLAKQASSGLKDEFTRTSNELRRDAEDYDFAQRKLAATLAKLKNPQVTKPDKVGGGGAVGDGITDEEQQKQATAYSTYLQSKSQNELEIQKLTNQLAEAEDKRHYEAGLITVDDYYDRMEARAKAEAEAENMILVQKLAAAAQLPSKTPEQSYKRLEEMGKIQTQITEVQMKGTADLAAAEDARAKAKVDDALKELESVKKLQQAEGDSRGAEQTGLEIELQQYSALLAKRKDLTDAQRSEALDSFRSRGEAKIDFQTNHKAAGGLMDDMNDSIGNVQDQAAAGAITQLAAEKQIHDLEVQRLPILQAMADVLTQNAEQSKDQDAIRAAAQYNASLQKIRLSLQNVTTAQTYLFNQLSTQGRQDFEDFFTGIMDGTKSASDAFKDLAADFESMVARMISKLLIYYALEALVGWVAPNSALASSLSSSGPFGKYADGGWTGGRAGQAAGIVHGEEFVVRAGPAAANLPLLQAINSGGRLGAIRPVSAAISTSSGYAKSIAGTVAAGADPVTTKVEVHNYSGQPVETSQTKTPDGGSMIRFIVGKAIEGVHQNVASGGGIAKTLEGQYGLSRSGVKRG